MALCMINRDAGVKDFLRVPQKGPLSPAQEFANDHISKILEKDYQNFEYHLSDFLMNDDVEWDEVHHALLVEALDYDNADCVRYIAGRVNELKLLKEVDFDQLGTKVVPDSLSRNEFPWNALSTPFICDSPYFMEVLLECGYDDQMKYTLWSDGKKICLSEVSLKDAALASGDEEMYDLLVAMQGDWGLVNSECVLLSDELDLMKRFLRVGFDTDSEALYWLSEETSRYALTLMDKPVTDLDIRKILGAANSVFLEMYLAEYGEIDDCVIRSWKDEVYHAATMKLTLGMFRDLADEHHCCCLPYNRNWIQQRKNKCISLLDAYLEGVRYDLDEEEGWDYWNGYDE